MENHVSNKDFQLAHSSEQIIVRLASALHDQWRQTRILPLSKKINPRWKPTKDELWIESHNGIEEVDIANTDYADLPKDWQAENRASAGVAIRLISKAVQEGRLLDVTFVEEASSVIHDEWVKRNTSWAPPDLKLRYWQLTEEEKEKDRVIIKLGIELHYQLQADESQSRNMSSTPKVIVEDIRQNVADSLS